MLKKKMMITGCALAMVFGGAPLMAAQDAASTKQQPPVVDKDPNSNGKTSDRTPGNPSPDRTPNASTMGAGGTDAGKTSEGTSDRSPDKTQKSMD